MKREIFIAGGGLAGLSLASALRLRHVPVTVQEAGSYPRHRVCGEFISGVSDETLSSLGITAAVDGARQHTSLAWFSQGRLIHRDKLDRPALGISRYLLDDRLSRGVLAAGGKIVLASRARPEPREGFVWTAGRKARRSSWVGLKAHVKLSGMEADLEMHAGTNGYAGLAGVEEGWTNLCGLFRIDRALRSTGPALLIQYLRAGGNLSLARRLEEIPWRSGSFCAVAGFELGPQPVTPGLLAIGDAESLIPPFTGNGMSMAFQAAEMAAPVLADWSRGTVSWQKATNLIRTSLKKKFRRRLTVAGWIHPILLNPASSSLLQELSSSVLLPFKPILRWVR